MLSSGWVYFDPHVLCLKPQLIHAVSFRNNFFIAISAQNEHVPTNDGKDFLFLVLVRRKDHRDALGVEDAVAE